MYRIYSYILEYKMYSRYFKKLALLSIFFTSFIYSSFGFSTVIMIGNRIIYPANSTGKMLQFSNPDDIPYILQLWTDINNPNSKPETADGPFIMSPQLFKIAPKQGQAVRLMFNNSQSLPTDRESIFYFNFLQLPGVSSEQREQNKLVLLVTSRLKIFYRPDALKVSPEDIPKKIKFKLNNKHLNIENDSPYYATFDKVELLGANQEVIAVIKDPAMLAPMSKQEWPITAAKIDKVVMVKYSLFNDFGVVVAHQFAL